MRRCKGGSVLGDTCAMKSYIDPFGETQMAKLATDVFESGEFNFDITSEITGTYLELSADSVQWPGVTPKELTLPGCGPQTVRPTLRMARGTDDPTMRIPVAWYPPKNGKLGG